MGRGIVQSEVVFLIWENGLAALSFTLATDDLLGNP
jgi:hypothetical protein